MKNLLSALLGFLLMTSAHAQTITPPTIAARAWLVLDASSQQVLASQEADTRVEPASLTKIMTAYLTFSAIRDKQLDMNQTINVSTHAWKVDSSSSKMFIEPDTAVRVTDLLHGLIVQSGNDAAVTLAEAVAGDQAAFTVLMNRQAAQMGLKNTRFANPHGLPDPNNYSTARDLSVLAWRLITDFPEFYKIYSVKSFTYNKISQSNRNRLLWLDETVDGMKTGHTQAAGYCLIASAVRPNDGGQRRLISVVLGAESDNMRAQESQKLLNWGFMNFQSFKIYSKDQAVLTPVVWKGSRDAVRLGFNRDVYVSLPRGLTAHLKSVVQRTDPLIAPIAQYRQVGTLKVLADGKVISELPLQALDQVNEATIFGRTLDSLRLLLPH
ncbi:MAG: D-alanyl-D-alanine carboxypeptidase [Oxalobacteraceae bacterium]|jgi:D-alanyl-D-alanine carboxypeptidase (penicillin-binding protein 5/6)|nr:D-alanyl-D-alanine carboxypeptidase [Oxalobacteraceae bacterium]